MRLVSYWRESRETPYLAIILTQAKIKVASATPESRGKPSLYLSLDDTKTHTSAHSPPSTTTFTVASPRHRTIIRLACQRRPLTAETSPSFSAAQRFVRFVLAHALTRTSKDRHLVTIDHSHRGRHRCPPRSLATRAYATFTLLPLMRNSNCFCANYRATAIGMNLEMKAETDLGSFVCENVDEIMVKTGPRNIGGMGNVFEVEVEVRT
ncbi:hypothetical protein DEO72_LG2g3040 [Vigna unguiculata]|uniref:Uncharacterized protein n=1 Tax=Vigna unguiculata TaxID=3917 RepID=A0A4D6L2K2_VIGUN|nr:hypothetical protein DEO72_LG2g3040 [Vigna unguiculata]